MRFEEGAAAILQNLLLLGFHGRIARFSKSLCSPHANIFHHFISCFSLGLASQQIFHHIFAARNNLFRRRCSGKQIKLFDEVHTTCYYIENYVNIREDSVLRVTIKDIAELASVSTATVSHVLNKTRYVSPELVSRVEAAIKETGYEVKMCDWAHQFRVGKLSEIAYVFPYMDSTTYMHIGNVMSNLFARSGYTLSAYPTSDNPVLEKRILTNLLADKRIAGIVLVPTDRDPKRYKALLSSNMPIVCLNRTINSENVSSVLFENISALYKGTMHLIRNGHKRICILISNRGAVAPSERLIGYKKALLEANIPYDESLVFKCEHDNDIQQNLIDLLTLKNPPSAFITSNSRLTFKFLKSLSALDLAYPEDFSVVGFVNIEWSEAICPSLTVLTPNSTRMAQLGAEMLLDMLENKRQSDETVYLPVELIIRKSTKSIELGPDGQAPISPEQILLTGEEIKRLKSGGFKVGLSFHYGGTEWARLYERAIRETLARYGVDIVAVNEAHFNPELQIMQLQSLRLQKLDAIISLPTDEQMMTDIYKALAKETKLIMIGNGPAGLNTKDYCAFISNNECENGRNAGRLLGDLFHGKTNAKVGLINYSSSLTSRRDWAVEQELLENYSNIELVAKESFSCIENAYQAAKELLQKHPEIEGLYVTWDRPALEVIRALKDLGRTDVLIITTDLDYEIASYMAHGEFVRGISAQRPYELGEAAALATARALLGETNFIYISVQPQSVTPLNLSRAWVEITHEGVPIFRTIK